MIINQITIEEDISKKKELKMNAESFDINCDNKLFTIEIYMRENESLIFEGYEKTSISKYIYKSSFKLKKLLDMSKVFKICDDLNEVFQLIQQKLKDNEIKIYLNDNLQLDMEFILPNKRMDKITFILLKEKLKESDIIDKLCINIDFLQKKNKSLEEQILNLKSLIPIKKSKTLIDILENKFKISKIILLDELYEELEKFDLKSEYLKEIGEKFQSKFKTIFNAKKDGDSLVGFMSKVFGKNNLAGYIAFYHEKNENFSCRSFVGQLALLNGKFEFKNNYLTFNKNDVFSYGTYATLEPKFIFFRDANAKIFLKIKNNCVYLIIYQNDELKTCSIKISDHFLSNPIITNRLTESYNDEENIIEKQFEERYYSNYLDKFYIKSLKIYQIEN